MKVLILLGSLFICATVSAEQPNVVMILADDQSFRDFGFMDNEIG